MYTCIVLTGKLSFAWTNRSHRKIPTWVFGFSQDDLAIYHALFFRKFFLQGKIRFILRFISLFVYSALHTLYMIYVQKRTTKYVVLLIISYCYHAVEFFTRIFYLLNLKKHGVVKLKLWWILKCNFHKWNEQGQPICYLLDF